VAIKNVWSASESEKVFLSKRRIFATQEDCQAVAEAFNEILAGGAE